MPGLWVIIAAVLPSLAGPALRPSEPVTWRLDSLTAIGGYPVSVAGTPRVVHTAIGPAVQFNGSTDGLFVDGNPLAGLARFTIEVLFEPSADGPQEQRFLHIEQKEPPSRALIELRMSPGGAWSLDTYLRTGETGLTLLDRRRAHPASRWTAAALTYDGKTMAHYVDGVREVSGEIAFPPLADGRTSIGVRQNRVSWFKGRIHTIRVSPEALPPDRLLRVPATERQVIALWPEGVPGAQPGGGDERLVDGRVYNVQVPSLTYVPVAAGTATGAAVIVCPGGSYARLAMASEAESVAARLQSRGIATFILKYRLAEYGHPAPLQDVLRAVRLLRSRAAEFGLRPDRIGVMGASAGGHLAAAAATLFDTAEGRTGAPLDSTSARPDFIALLYPVITMRPPFTHAESRRNLLGATPDAAIVERLSLDTQVTRATPPVFLVHTAEDTSVPLENSLRFYEALRRHGVPAELHLYHRGRHGFGTTAGVGPASGWVDRWIEWMDAHGWLEAAWSNAR